MWGSGEDGQMAQNSETYYSSPVQVPGKWVSFSTAQKAMFGINAYGQLWGWGANSNGDLGVNNRTKYSSPVQVHAGNDNWGKVRGYTSSTLGYQTDGTLWSWGYNQRGSLGHNQSQPTVARKSMPVQIPGTNWTQEFSGGEYFKACVRRDGSLWAWGANNYCLLYTSPSPRDRG